MTFALCIAQEFIIFKKPFVTNKFIPFFLATHLVNQKYDVCMRKESGKKLNCYFPLSPASGAVGTATINMGTFGLSVSPSATASQAGANSKCITDYIQIPGAEKSSIANAVPSTIYGNRFCGRLFNTEAQTTHATFCSE